MPNIRGLTGGRTAREVLLELDDLYAVEKDSRKLKRLLAARLILKNEHTNEQIASISGVSRGRIQEWIRIWRESGLDTFLHRKKPGRKPGSPPKGIDSEIFEQLRQKLEKGVFTTATQAQRWLQAEHGIVFKYKKVWDCLKKLGGVLVKPRPSHSKKDPAAAEEFRKTLGAKLESLQIESGSNVKVWMMDEARFGLHTDLRHVWTLKGLSHTVTQQIKYQWDYLHGSLDVMKGEAHFCHISNISHETDRLYLEDLVKNFPDMIHIIIRDQAGFHLRDGDERLPACIRIVNLPPCSPELNACEQLWDIVKDEICNKVYESIEALRIAMFPALKRWWEDARAVIRLVGREWLGLQVNALQKNPALI